MSSFTEMVLVFAFLWVHIVGTCLVGFVAGEKGRSWGWAVASLLVAGPILCLIALAALPPKAPRVVTEREALASFRPAPTAPPIASTASARD